MCGCVCVGVCGGGGGVWTLHDSKCQVINLPRTNNNSLHTSPIPQSPPTVQSTGGGGGGGVFKCTWKVQDSAKSFLCPLEMSGEFWILVPSTPPNFGDGLNLYIPTLIGLHMRTTCKYSCGK